MPISIFFSAKFSTLTTHAFSKILCLPPLRTSDLHRTYTATIAVGFTISLQSLFDLAHMVVIFVWYLVTGETPGNPHGVAMATADIMSLCHRPIAKMYNLLGYWELCMFPEHHFQNKNYAFLYFWNIL